MRPSFLSLLFISTYLALAKAIKFDLPAVSLDRASEGAKCLSQYIAKDNLVLATVVVGEGYNQRVELEANYLKLIYTLSLTLNSLDRLKMMMKVATYIQKRAI